MQGKIFGPSFERLKPKVQELNEKQMHSWQEGVSLARVSIKFNTSLTPYNISQ